MNSLSDLIFVRLSPSHFDDLVNTYNYTTLSALLDKHPPLRLRSVVLTCTDKTHVYLAGQWGGGVRRVRSTPPPSHRPQRFTFLVDQRLKRLCTGKLENTVK